LKSKKGILSQTLREKAGKATDDNETEAKGKAEQVEGKVQEKYGEAKDALKK
jgi:uncharacterized protein YjbJ (UPF0337 family)